MEIFNISFTLSQIIFDIAILVIIIKMQKINRKILYKKLLNIKRLVNNDKKEFD